MSEICEIDLDETSGAKTWVYCRVCGHEWSTNAKIPRCSMCGSSKVDVVPCIRPCPAILELTERVAVLEKKISAPTLLDQVVNLIVPDS